MKSHRLRKLLQMYDAGGDDGGMAPPSLARDHEPITPVQNATSSASPPSKSPSAFDSSMALTIFVLLIALFFMGFFSVYIRHFADDSTADISPPRRTRRSPRMSPRRHSPSASRPFDSRKGLDSQAVRSLPVHRYRLGAKQRMMVEDCAICLSDFEEGEAVKEIPYCGHVFHVECVDTWLSSHVSCPFCRSTQLFLFSDDKAGGGGGGLVIEVPQGTSDRGRSAGSSRRSTAENDDTCARVGLRRSCSCSSLGRRVGLDRASSF